MRAAAVSTIVCLALAIAGAAQAQVKGGATRTTDDYVCTFSPESCERTDEGATMEAPDTKGFRLARPGAAATTTTRAAPAATARQPRAIARSTTRASAPRAAGRTAPATVARRSTGRGAARGAVAAVPPAERRADLRLAFEYNSAQLTPQAREEARVFAEAMQRPELKAKRFLIEGHTDSVGGRAYNLDLSQRRAKAVADYLSSLGVSRDRLDIRGYGFDRPVPGQTAAAASNRRVEAVLVF